MQFFCPRNSGYSCLLPLYRNEAFHFSLRGCSFVPLLLIKTYSPYDPLPVIPCITLITIVHKQHPLVPMVAVKQVFLTFTLGERHSLLRLSEFFFRVDWKQCSASTDASCAELYGCDVYLKNSKRWRLRKHFRALNWNESAYNHCMTSSTQRYFTASCENLAVARDAVDGGLYSH